MEKERQAHENGNSGAHPVVLAAVTAAMAVLLGWAAARGLRLGLHLSVVDYVGVGLLNFVTAWLAGDWVKRRGRVGLLGAGVVGMAVCLTAVGWVLHTSNFQLTAKSYQALDAAKVPADLIAELKNAEGAAADTGAQFVSDLASRFGPEHIAPYQEQLIESGWNIHRRRALAALVGFGLCFSLTAGAALTGRVKQMRQVEPLETCA